MKAEEDGGQFERVATGRRIENPPSDQRSPCGLRELSKCSRAPVVYWFLGGGKGDQLVSSRCFFTPRHLHPEFNLTSGYRRRERKRLECKMWPGERLLYLCLNKRHTQVDQDKARGPRVLPSRVEDNLERFLLLHVPKFPIFDIHRQTSTANQVY